ncbi:MAG: PilN domain-containing protein [Oligoflexia bacterium]|nr:PilN domain-containing protein [Oligoflexia bacterium]
MIKINLLGEDTVVDNSHNLLIAAYVASLLVCLGIFYYLNDSISVEVAQKTTEAGKLERQLAALQETTKEVKELDRKRAELNDKLVVIATLKRNKVGPVKVMDDLNMSLPERAWLTDIKESGSILRISGFALDNQTIATFMKDLQASEYFTSVDLVETKQVEERGVKVKDFTLDAKISYTGKLRIKKSDEAAGPTKS